MVQMHIEWLWQQVLKGAWSLTRMETTLLFKMASRLSSHTLLWATKLYPSITGQICQIVEARLLAANTRKATTHLDSSLPHTPGRRSQALVQRRIIQNCKGQGTPLNDSSQPILDHTSKMPLSIAISLPLITLRNKYGQTRPTAETRPVISNKQIKQLQLPRSSLSGMLRLITQGSQLMQTQLKSHALW